MGCGESKHAVATENTISRSQSKKSNSKRIADKSVEDEAKLIKEPVEKSLEEGKENAKVTDNGNGNGESKVEENVNAKLDEGKKGGNAKETDNGNGKPEAEENVKEEKLEAPVAAVEEKKEGKSDEISVHQEEVVDVQEPDAEKLNGEEESIESIIPEENASEGKMDNVEGKEIIQDAKEDPKTEHAIKVEEAKDVKEEEEEVVLPIAETENSATKKE